MADKNPSIKLNITLNALRMVLSVLVPLITFPYLSRIFLADGMGKLNFSNSVAQILTAFASLGIYTYGVKEGAKIRQNKILFSRFAHELFTLNCISTVISYLIFLICLFVVPSFKDKITLLLIYSTTAPFAALCMDWVYGVYEEYKYITVRQIIGQIFLIVTMFVFIHHPKDIYLWAILLAASSIGANIVNAIHSQKYITFKGNRSLKFKRHIPQVMILFATQLSSKVYNNLDTVLLGILSTNYNTGIYSAAVKVNTVLVTMFSAMTPVFVPRIMGEIQSNNYEKYNVIIKKIFSLILALGLPCVIGMELLSENIIILLAGEGFADATATMRWLAPIVLITSLSNIIYYDVLVPFNKEKNVLTCTSISLLINLIVSTVLIPTLKENGAAIGSLVAELIGLLMSMYYAKKVGFLSSKCIPSILNYVIGTIGIVFSCVICKLILPCTLLFHLIVPICLSIFVYGIILFLLHDPLAIEGIETIKNIVIKGKNK